MQLCPGACRLTPLLRGVREEAREGSYTLVLEFETKEQMTLDMWETRVNKIETFFGPGINAEVGGPSSNALETIDCLTQVSCRCINCTLPKWSWPHIPYR